MIPRDVVLRAIRTHDFRESHGILRHWLQDDGGRPLSPLELTYLSSYALRARDMELRSVVHEHARRFAIGPHDGADYREGIALVFFQLGLSFLPDTIQMTEWLEKSLAAVPGFLPAAVELEIIRRGLNREATLRCLAEDVPVGAWQYDSVAAQLSLPGNANLAASNPDPGQVVGLALRGHCSDRTPALLRHYRRAIGDRPFYLSTWKHTDPAILHLARDLCDEVVLLPNVENPGRQNRVRQIVLSQAAVEAAAKKCDFLLLTRTDIAIFRHNFLDTLRAVWHWFPISDNNLRGRIIIPEIYTRKFMTDHPSDMLTFGAVDDLIQFWGCLPSGDVDPDIVPEKYISREFRKKLGIFGGADNLTIQQNLAYLRDYFVVRDFSWLEAWWLGRGGAQMAATSQMDYEGLLNQSAWEALQFSPGGLPSEFGWTPDLPGAMTEWLIPHSLR